MTDVLIQSTLWFMLILGIYFLITPSKKSTGSLNDHFKQLIDDIKKETDDIQVKSKYKKI